MSAKLEETVHGKFVEITNQIKLLKVLVEDNKKRSGTATYEEQLSS